MKRPFLTFSLFLALIISLPVNVLFAQDEVDCMPYSGYRPDYQIFSATHPSGKIKPWSAISFGNNITKIQDLIDFNEPYERVNDALKELLNKEKFAPYNHYFALLIYGDLLSLFLADNTLADQEQIGYYVDYVMKEKGLYIDYIVQTLSFLRGYWSDSRIDSVATVSHEVILEMLTQYEESNYPPALRKKYAKSGKYEQDWACVAILYRPLLDDLLAFMED